MKIPPPKNDINSLGEPIASSEPLFKNN